MATGHPDLPDHVDIRPESASSWDGRARCRLCADDTGHDHDWCAAAGALVCDACCDEVLGGEAGRLHSAAKAESRTIAPLEVLTSCALCPRAERILDAEDDGSPADATQLH